MMLSDVQKRPYNQQQISKRVTLTKEKLARQMALKFHLSVSESERVINFTLEQYKKFLRGKNRIEFRGFGSFYVTIMPARKYKHPKTEKMVYIPKSKRTVFRQSRNLFPRKRKIRS